MEELNTEELGSIWSYEESIDELKQQLLCTTIELESLKVEANEEMRRHKEDVKKLLNLIKIAYQERDEAKDQLQKLIIKVLPSSPTQLSPILPQAQPVRPFVMPTRANSSITESDSLSDTYNHQSHGSSPVDSFFDAVTSPDFLSISMADSSHMGVANKTFVQEHACSVPNSVVPPAVAKIDPSDSIIDNLVKGRFLPQKGNLVQSVMESGPLLQTLLLAGPLPRWRNPPPQQPFKIPPVSMKACEITTNTCQKTAAVPGCIPLKQLSSPSSLEISRGPSRICSASLLNISGYAAGSALRNGQLLDSGVISQIPTGKRQRLQ